MLTTLSFLALVAIVVASAAFGVWTVLRTLIGTRMTAPATATTAAPTVPSRWRLDSLTARTLAIGLLALLMLIPLAFVEDIVTERGARHAEVLADIGGTWGRSQTLAGPVLAVPFTEASVVEETVVGEDGASGTRERTVRRQRVAHFLPTMLDIDVRLDDEERRRGLFRARVYTAEIALEARFDPIDVAPLSDTLERVHWERAWIDVGLSDTRAIGEVSTFDWDGEAIPLAPGSRLQALPSGFHATLTELAPERSHTLVARLLVRGSGDFRFAPFGEETTASVRSDWPHPSFRGDALPSERDVSDAGFAATWRLPHLARNYPQAWTGAPGQDLFELTAGASLFETVSLYSQVTRAVKYGLLFVGLTYLALLAFESALGRPLHALQYALVGVALCVFFLVLLALAEHVGFTLAYASAAALSVAMIALYTAAVLRSAARGFAVLALLAGLYAILFSLLRLEDYALLLGTALLVAIVAVLMAATRNLHRQSATPGVARADGARPGGPGRGGGPSEDGVPT